MKTFLKNIVLGAVLLASAAMLGACVGYVDGGPDYYGPAYGGVVIYGHPYYGGGGYWGGPGGRRWR
jgi:hypothetical protein